MVVDLATMNRTWPRRWPTSRGLATSSGPDSRVALLGASHELLEHLEQMNRRLSCPAEGCERQAVDQRFEG